MGNGRRFTIHRGRDHFFVVSRVSIVALPAEEALCGFSIIDPEVENDDPSKRCEVFVNSVGFF